MTNKLINEKSPYLLQHAHNPVNWYPWCDEAFDEAKKRNKPIFLSIGYSSCHWCHVMEKESFEDNEIAKIMNDNFISIKVDREERADIDNFYMDACVAFTSSGGWPLSAFLNHDKVPFFAGTYFPKEDMPYSLGFKSILRNISILWKTDKNKITSAGSDLLNYLKKDENMNESSYKIDIDSFYKKTEHIFDMENGGILGAPKFPSVPTLLFLFEYNKKYPSSNAKKILDITLSKMSLGGIFDHIGGGFFRYSTDERWLIPHFEKMLYDNALLLLLYSIASKEIDKKYEITARKTAEYLMRDMHNKNGGFYTAQDADSEGIEGKYYLFTPQEINNVLGDEEGRKFCEDYEITENGNFKGLNIPNRINMNLINEDLRIQKIIEYRYRRKSPLLDDKIITSSNSLMIIALTISGKILNEKKWIDEAEKTADFILNNLYKDNRLYARFKDNDVAHKSTLDDYAFLDLGLLELYKTTFNVKWLKKSIEMTDDMINLFSDNNSGFYLSGNDVKDLPLRQKSYKDSALPSGNAIALECFLILYEITKNDKYKVYYENIISSYKNLIKNDSFSYYSFLSAFLLEENYLNITLSEGININDYLNILNGYNPFIIISLRDNNFYNLMKEKNMYNDEMKTDNDISEISNMKEKITKAQICNNSKCYPILENPEDLNNFLR